MNNHNAQTPPILLFVRNSFLFNDESAKGVTAGHLISVRSLKSQALQFQVLLETGALFTGLPANALCFREEAPPRSLHECCHWDSVSGNIQVFQLDELLYMPCTLKMMPTGEIIPGRYLFSIDFCGSNDLSRNPIHWKQFHAIESNEGNFHVYAQYRIQFKDSALCPDSDKPLPKYAYNDKIWTLGS